MADIVFQTRKSVLAIVKEVTEGTPVLPSAATDYIALQDGFSLEPSFDQLENAELRSSIGQAKPIQGLENPSGSLNHYIRHSGVEGQAPNFGDLIEAAFGAVTVAGAEYDTVGGSTAGDSTTPPAIEVDTGEGVNYERGMALLIKDSVNGYSLRNVKSVAVDTLTANFNLPGAPASGVNLGQAVLYKPGESHPSLTGVLYRGNGGVVEVASGLRVSEMAMEVTAAELINGSFSFEGVKYYMNPIEITASNKFVDFNDGAVQVASIAEKLYTDPHELAAALQTAMDGQSTDNITVTYSDADGKFDITTDGVTLSLLWNTGANTANTIGASIGFDTAADDTGATAYESDNAQTLTSPYTPSLDASDPLVAKANEVLIGNHDDNISFCARSLNFTLSNEITQRLCIDSESGKKGTLITGREVSVEVVGEMQRYDVDKFKRFKNNEDTEFLFNFGTKTGGNWDAGKSGNLYIPSATIGEFSHGDEDGLVSVNFTINAFVDNNGNGEVYLNFI